MNSDDPKGRSAPAAWVSGALPAVRQINADELFAGRKEVVITHNLDRYVLRITRHGKLILNK